MYSTPAKAVASVNVKSGVSSRNAALFTSIESARYTTYESASSCGSHVITTESQYAEVPESVANTSVGEIGSVAVQPDATLPVSLSTSQLLVAVIQ